MIPTDHDLEPCPHGCGDQVLVTITEHGRRLAVNAAPDPGGNTAIWRNGAGTWRSRALNGAEAMRLLTYEELAMPHIATSPACSPQPRQMPLPGLAVYVPRARRRTVRLPRHDRRTR